MSFLLKIRTSNTITTEMPKLCEYLNCKRRASYGFFNGKPKRCPTHGRLGNMKPQYSICRCRKSHPTYNEPGETRPICCSECKTETMVNVKNKMCPGQGEERGCVLNKGTGSTKDIVHIVLVICFPQIL